VAHSCQLEDFAAKFIANSGLPAVELSTTLVVRFFEDKKR
jgi:hypothetical protein